MASWELAKLQQGSHIRVSGENIFTMFVKLARSQIKLQLVSSRSSLGGVS